MEIDYTKVVADVSKEIVKDAYNDVAHPAAQNAGGVLGTITGFFNHVVLYPLKKLNIKYEQKAIEFQRGFEKKYEKVPEENRVEPQINIVGPTLESLKYNIMEDDLAEMFSNLLVSNMDKTTQGLCTPSFVKVIEQLTPNDARTFATMYRRFKQDDKLPVSSIKYTLEKDSKYTLREEYYPKYFTNFAVKDISGSELSKSLQNLHRLGLIEIDFMKHYTDQSVYEAILNSNEVASIIEWTRCVLNEQYRAETKSKGVIFMNEFSHDFAKVCLRN